MQTFLHRKRKRCGSCLSVWGPLFRLFSYRLGVHLLGMELLNSVTYCTEGKIITVYGIQKTPTPPAPVYGNKGKALKLQTMPLNTSWSIFFMLANKCCGNFLNLWSHLLVEWWFLTLWYLGWLRLFLKKEQQFTNIAYRYGVQFLGINSSLLRL